MLQNQKNAGNDFHNHKKPVIKKSFPAFSDCGRYVLFFYMLNGNSCKSIENGEQGS